MASREQVRLGNFLLIYICNFHVLNHLLLIYICKLHWNQVGMNESMLTGESMVVAKKAGAILYGGTVVVEGSGLVLVQATGDDSTLGRIVLTVQDSQVNHF
jgi:E1-E2 ATPase